MSESRFELTEWELYSKEPEALCVGELNRTVRVLREAVYQERLLKQDLLAALREIAEDEKPGGWQRAIALEAIAKAEGC